LNKPFAIRIRFCHNFYSRKEFKGLQVIPLTYALT
jgi:hypothetical protein